jgi:hypothetical protein
VVVVECDETVLALERSVAADVVVALLDGGTVETTR